MKYLIDTNIIIPLEPTRLGDLEATTPQAFQFTQLAHGAGQTLFVHPASQVDLDRDKDRERRELRRQCLARYTSLPRPPRISEDIEAELGVVPEGGNHWVDHQLLAAVAADAVDFLVTEDAQLQRKALRLGLDDRVLSLDDALSAVRALFPKQPDPPPAVVSTLAHDLDGKDPIFDGLRSDYKGFDKWLSKCKKEHRQTWLISSFKAYDALCIAKGEEEGPAGTPTALKLCTFKVSTHAQGRRYGELLLKAIFEYAFQNEYSSIFVTAYTKQTHLIRMFEDFGFVSSLDEEYPEEVVLRKSLKADSAVNSLAPLEAHRRYGPNFIQWAGASSFVVPIKPNYHKLLFPELENQPLLPSLSGHHPFGNAIRKAYLCHAMIKSIRPGDVLVFYRSTDEKRATVLGVVEDTLRSSDPREVARLVARRTVYSFEAIEQMCADQGLLAVRFRSAWGLDRAISLQELVQNRVLSGPPQSIVTVRNREAHSWLQTRTIRSPS